MSRYRTYSIRFTKTAKKQFESFDKKIQEEVTKVLERELAGNPLAGKPLQGPLKNLRSLRIGNLRIIYKQMKSGCVIVVIRIEHRKDAYRRKTK